MAQLLPPNERGCRLWPKVGGRGGYGKTWYNGRSYLAHQVAFLIANGWVPSGRQIIIRHTCDTPLCCEPSHLLPGTQADNARDRDERGRAARQTSWEHPLAKLTPDQVREIRDRHAAGESYATLGKAFGLHRQNIGRIVRGRGYADVT